MDNEQFDSYTLEHCNVLLQVLKNINKPIPEALQKRYNELILAQKAETSVTNDDTPIYSTLVANYPYGVMPQEKKKCIEQTVDLLLEEGPGAEAPGLLLGKIQCGKTDTFEDIIGLAFDKGIDICVILTKGTNALTQQTLKRIKKDYSCLCKDKESLNSIIINIYDILEVRRNPKKGVIDRNKTVIVCKKETTNLDHLINMFQVNDFLQKKRVLIVDDEADFASRNYQSLKVDAQIDERGEVKTQQPILTMAKVSQQIDDFRGIPAYCRYLQVTATPYCLYLQPNGELNLGTEENKTIVKPFRPRFTTLVPTHDRYVGGHEYFELSQDTESMYSHLFKKVDKICVDVMGKADLRYLRHRTESQNTKDLTYALTSFFMATAIRCIQRSDEGKRYRGSALFHVDLNKKNHEWQKQLIDALIESIRQVVIDNDRGDRRVWDHITAAYDSFAESNRKGIENGLISTPIPTRAAVEERLKEILQQNDFHVQVVNSDEQVSTLLDDESGELRLDSVANIFIGGNILDRGVTIKNMLCFFYGRNPKNFQQDTVLQHARMYGARSKEDMAVTRFHTTEQIYQILKRINDLDNQLREWFIQGKDQQYGNAVFVGYDSNIKPCAAQKIKASNALVIKKQNRILPVGFNTFTLAETQNTMAQIDQLIKASAQNRQPDSFGFWETDYDKINAILELIDTTYNYSECDKEHLNDFKHLLCALKYCVDRSGGKVYVMQRTDRNMGRRQSDGSWTRSPEHGASELAPAREKATDAPVVMLFRQNGKTENGWNGAPFYWPVLLTQKKLDSTIFALEQRRQRAEVPVCPLDKLEGIDEREVLRMTYMGDLEERFGIEGTIYNVDKGEHEAESRVLKETTAGLYLEKDDNGGWLRNPDIEFDTEHDYGVYSRNGGRFPFVLRPYKYMVLSRGRTATAPRMLLKLADMQHWNVCQWGRFDQKGDLYARIDFGKEPHPDLLMHCADTVLDRDLRGTPEIQRNVTVWKIAYPVERVLKMWNPAEME